MLTRLKHSAQTSGAADICPFMDWIFTLPNVTLSNNVMEDPHDFLVPLWQFMSMAGGDCYDQCGESCAYRQLHLKMMNIGVNVAHQYECTTCRGRWLRHINGYEWCVSLSLPSQGQISVDTLLHTHCSEGVVDVVDSRYCSCSSVDTVYTARMRKILSMSDASQGKGVSILANNVYFGNDGRTYKYTDRYCVPSLDINIGGRAYTLSSFIEHRPLSSSSINSAEVGHYVAYVRLSEDGLVWKVANDGVEELRTWGQVAGVHGHLFFYTE